jgi:pseudouridine-5'-phosphate glycosidase
MMNLPDILYSEEVRQARDHGTPVIALESTIISHGMPYPVNLETTQAVEEIIRQNGCVPATIAILDGRIHVGVDAEELLFLSTAKNILKASERDIPFVLAAGRHAATTVSGTLMVASLAGIPVFATGGIGGVGPDASTTFDISADLLSIGKFPCITVCAGAKSFMDIPATLEFLETYSVPVIVYQSDHFPLFYARDSGVKVDWVAQNARDIADVFNTKQALHQPGGILVAVPIPEDNAIPETEIKKVIAQALQKVNAEGVTGKQFTPRVLTLIKEISGGKSLGANVALIKHNAEIAAKIAMELAR